ncbi:unnamed protein product [Paramecium octaurelia]|uniref:Uncharacterized protein n=1 Tax=Paramecium octaurelia TaxID=43137 RepID=A0A8S1T5K7_PAROT|nr:unnamed protein product [Paramecium octaurelia]
MDFISQGYPNYSVLREINDNTILDGLVIETKMFANHLLR